MRMNKKKDHKRWVPKEGKEISVRLSNPASFESLRLLKYLCIEETFLELPPEKWEHDAGFQEGRVKLKKLKVVNNGAEREVAMVSAFNDSLTKDEETKQMLLEVVKHHHHLHPLKGHFKLV